ncbi:50S ribosomal protein L24 [Candidatus Aerophobetes bacterium]|nr:50S ribosomal protein L24 [Candidatus Aerophobetes bacterium]
MSRIKVGDQVVVLSGKDKGKVGKVIQRIPKEDKIVVEGVNIVKRHIRATRRGQDSGIVAKEAPIPSCKVMLICPRCGKRTRIGVKINILSNGEKEKLRICKKCQEVID